MLKLSPNLLLFSDLDGSLLDHHSYRWDAAQPWLDRLAQHQVPLIIATSKTAAEVGLLQQQLKLTHLPFIAENGAQIVFPADRQETDKVFSADYATLRATLAELRASRQFTFEGFADVDDATVAAWTGLPLADAQRARQRAGSEPLRWLGNDTQLTVFSSQLAQHGLTLTQGGRFYHVMGENVSKGHAARWLTEYYQRRRQQPVITLCLGDGPNDIPLLSTADYAVAIRGQQDTAIDFPSDFAGQLYRTHQAGPQGWSEGLDHFLEKQP